LSSSVCAQDSKNLPNSHSVALASKSQHGELTRDTPHTGHQSFLILSILVDIFNVHLQIRKDFICHINFIRKDEKLGFFHLEMSDSIERQPIQQNMRAAQKTLCEPNRTTKSRAAGFKARPCVIRTLPQSSQFLY
jgi:hypothetical protein